ncbi:MAG: DNA gyrase subunit A [bacterium]
MTQSENEILAVNLEDEMRQSYLDYAMSVIVGRALPDVRDGLKPVHRRVLYAMNVLGNDWNKAYKKSARVVGDVIGKYHPHGDTAVYDTIVRMAQPFSLRYMLVDGQGNFGSVDGDSAAAMRYTEIRMSRIAHELLADLDKDTVDFVANYDESEHEPSVMPTRVPNLLVNGSAGIAVGMATNIPPHNLTEIISATIALLDDSELDVEALMEYVPGPDFPTQGIINGAAGIRQAYRTGRGRVHIRARHHVETDERNGKNSLIFTELPYQVNKARLLEKIAALVKEKKLVGITAMRDESDKDGMRMVIELKRGEVPEVILNNLFQQTQLQSVFGINMVALVDGRPQLLNLKQILSAFIRHRREVVTRRTLFELRKARARAHTLEGLTVALANIDPIIALIKQSPTPAIAKERLIEGCWDPGVVKAMLEAAGSDASKPEDLEDNVGLTEQGYKLSARQAQAILELKLHRLTGLEQEKLTNEFKEILNIIEELLRILSDPDRLKEVVQGELEDIRDRYGDERRTEIRQDFSGLSLEDLIPEEDVVVTLSHAGYAKIQPLESYQAQHRGGRGKAATRMKDEDFIDQLWVANTHDTLLCFSDGGKVYWTKVFELPQAGRTARGMPIVNLLPLEKDERITAVLPVRDYPDDKFLFFATSNGTVKKTQLSAYSRPRANGIKAIDLVEGDHLIDVSLTDGSKDIMLFSSAGKVIRFNETDLRILGRVSRGVRGMRIPESQRVVSMLVVKRDFVLTATENGYGKRTRIEEFSAQGRGGQGVIGQQTSERNGPLVAAVQVAEGDELMLITDGGTLVRTLTEEVSIVGRNTQGVRLIKLSKNEKLTSVARIDSSLTAGDEESQQDADEKNELDVELDQSPADE